MLTLFDEEYGSHQVAADSFDQKVTRPVPEVQRSQGDLFKGMTTAAIINLVRALETQKGSPQEKWGCSHSWQHVRQSQAYNILQNRGPWLGDKACDSMLPVWCLGRRWTPWSTRSAREKRCCSTLAQCPTTKLGTEPAR